MPRLPPSLIQQAIWIDPHLPKLLRECRDLPSAINELRWLKETILYNELGIDASTWSLNNASVWHLTSSAGRKLESFVGRRGQGEPLQYILGTQPFGELEILCRRNVLIPRWETEVYTSKVVDILRQTDGASAVRIADICSGSGCIALLLHALLKPCGAQEARRILIRGYDVSGHALRLAQANLRHNIRLKHLNQSAAENVRFEHTDIMALAQRSIDSIRCEIAKGLVSEHESADTRLFDVIVSNPPYISPKHYAPGGSTSRSARKFEPKLALVPSGTLAFPGVDQADQFYVALLRIAVATKARLLVMEVGDNEQAVRVKKLCQQLHLYAECGPSKAQHLVEVWKDDGNVAAEEDSGQITPTSDDDEAECRAVVIYFDDLLRS